MEAEQSVQPESTHRSLREIMQATLHANFQCRVRYVHTPPKACEPLFSPLPSAEPERTRLASHFLTVSVPISCITTTNVESEINGHGSADDVLIFAVEVLVYSTQRLTTMFVSKADSTGYLPRQKPSSIKTITSTFLEWLAERQRRKYPERKLVISLFARAQSQYLFPASVENAKKHVLDDRQLIKWWARVLDPLFPKESELPASTVAQKTNYRGYITVPSYDNKEVIRLFRPPYSHSSSVSQHWIGGNPLRELAEARELPEHAPVRSLLPRFPDDPKARFMQDLDDEVGLMEDAGPMTTTSPSKRKSGRWKSIHDLDRFWEAMEFRQECSSGRVVGFLWLVISTKESALPDSRSVYASQTDLGSSFSQESVVSTVSSELPEPEECSSSVSGSPKKAKRKPLRGPIVARQPRLKGGSSSLSVTSEPNGTAKAAEEGVSLTKEGYDKAMHTLLNLDFGDEQAAVRSTTKWVADVCSIAGVKEATWTMYVTGTAKTDEVGEHQSSDRNPQVNNIGGMTRKKRKPEDTGGMESNEITTASVELAKVPMVPVVNSLGVGLVRKKPKTVQ